MCVDYVHVSVYRHICPLTHSFIYTFNKDNLPTKCRLN